MNTQIYVADTTPLFDEDCFNSSAARIPAWRMEKAARYKNIKDRAACTGAYLLLVHALREKGFTGIIPDFIYGEHNKPYLKDIQNIYFNLSHSGTKVMCIISDSECGCDVQRIEKKGDKIAARFFSSEETSYLNSIADEELGKIIFYKIWSIKESYLKALGTGLAGRLDSFSVDLDSIAITYNDMSMADADHIAHYEHGRLDIKLYNIDREYVYAAAGTLLPDDINIISIPDILLR